MTDFTAGMSAAPTQPDTNSAYRSSDGGRSSDGPMAHASASPLRYLLLLRFIVVNATGAALLAAAWVQGWIDAVIRSDDTGLSLAIFCVFLVGLAIAAHKIWRTSYELNEIHSLHPHPSSRVARYVADVAARDAASRAIFASSLRLKIFARIAVVRHIAGSLVFLGLIGTVVGFIIALSGVDPDKVGDVAAIGPMVSTLIEGMSVALYTTLVGGVLNIWLSINHNILTTGTVNLVTGIVALGERLSEDR